MTETTRSKDGTKIAYESAGEGPPLVLLGGAFSDRHAGGDLLPLLTDRFTVVTMDRRGRGDSGDTPPYAPAREVEDLEAVIAAVGGAAAVHGHSSGGVLALEAAAAGAPITKLSVYEPPYLTDPTGGERSSATRREIQAAVDRGDRDTAAELFMRATGAPFDPAVKEAPWWPGLAALAHTLPYDLALVGDGSVPRERLARIAVPVLGVYGGDSPEWAGKAIRAVTAAIPGATEKMLPGQTHGVDPAVMAPILAEWLTRA